MKGVVEGYPLRIEATDVQVRQDQDTTGLPWPLQTAELIVIMVFVFVGYYLCFYWRSDGSCLRAGFLSTL